MNRRQRTDRGASAVEFALILVPFVTLLFGLLQYGLYFYSAQSGSHVTSRTVRQLSVGNCQNSTQLEAYVLAGLGNATTAASVSDPKFKVVATYLDSGGNIIPVNSDAIGEKVQLEVEFPTLNMHFPFVPFMSDETVKRTLDARIEDVSDEGCPS